MFATVSAAANEPTFAASLIRRLASQYQLFGALLAGQAHLVYPDSLRARAAQVTKQQALAALTKLRDVAKASSVKDVQLAVSGAFAWRVHSALVLLVHRVLEIMQVGELELVYLGKWPWHGSVGVSD